MFEQFLFPCIAYCFPLPSHEKRPSSTTLLFLILIFCTGACSLIPSTFLYEHPAARHDRISIPANHVQRDLAEACVAADNALAVLEMADVQQNGWYPCDRFITEDYAVDGSTSTIDDIDEWKKAFQNVESKIPNNEDLNFWDFVYWVNRRQPADLDDWEFTYLLSFPFIILADLARHAVVEDADSLMLPTTFDTFVIFDGVKEEDTKRIHAGLSRSLDDSLKIGVDDTFEISLKYLAVDNLTEGRLRDGWGGSGAELNLQVSMHALTEKGKLVREDTDFLIREERKRRSVLLAALRATDKGTAFADKLVAKVEKVLEKIEDFENNKPIWDEVAKTLLAIQDDLNDPEAHRVKDLYQKLDEWKATLDERVDDLEDRLRRLGKDAESRTIQHLKRLSGNIRKKLQEQMGDASAGTSKDLLAEAVQVLEMVAEELTSRLFDLVEDRISIRIQEMRSKLWDYMEKKSGDIPAWEGLDIEVSHILTEAVKIMQRFDVFAIASQIIERFGADDKGLYEKVEVIKGLADADRLASFDFTGIRPSAATSKHITQWSMDSIETAALVFNHKAFRASDAVLTRPEGVIFRGKLSDLSEIGQAHGLSLSILLLERDSDQLAQAIRYVEQYARDRDLELSVAGTSVELSAVAEAMALIAEKIAQDDVELKSIDLRFAAMEPESGSSPGKPVLRLRPCRVLVTRNFYGAADFGAVALIEIRKIGETIE